MAFPQRKINRWDIEAPNAIEPTLLRLFASPHYYSARALSAWRERHKGIDRALPRLFISFVSYWLDMIARLVEL
jgi:hypothetical protein